MGNVLYCNSTGDIPIINCIPDFVLKNEMLLTGLFFLLTLIFLGWCFYDWIKHPENWDEDKSGGVVNDKLE